MKKLTAIQSNSDTEIYADDTEMDYSLDEDLDDSDLMYDKDHMTKLISQSLGISMTDAALVYDAYRMEDAFDDFYSIDEFIDFMQDDIYDLLDACDDEVVKQRILDQL